MLRCAGSGPICMLDPCQFHEHAKIRLPHRRSESFIASLSTVGDSTTMHKLVRGHCACQASLAASSPGLNLQESLQDLVSHLDCGGISLLASFVEALSRNDSDNYQRLFPDDSHCLIPFMRPAASRKSRSGPEPSACPRTTRFTSHTIALRCEQKSPAQCD